MSENKPFYKKKWFIAIVAILVLGGIGSLFTEGDPATEEPQASQDQAESEKPPAPKDEEAKAKYKEAVHDPYMRAVDRYDQLGVQFLGLFERMGSGQVDEFGAYTELQDLQKEYDVLANVFNNLFELDSFTDEDTDNFKQGKSSLEAGARLMSGVAKDLAKAIDKGDLSPSTVEKLTARIQDAETEISVGMSHMVDLDKSFGITLEDVQTDANAPQ